MTKTFMMLGATLSMGFAYGQEYNRVGINTEVPQATLDVRETPLGLLPAGTPQGVSFPNFSSDGRTKFTGVSEGTMIYNTDLDCIEQYTLREKISPNLDWYCMCLCEEGEAELLVDDVILLTLQGFERFVEIDYDTPFMSSSRMTTIPVYTIKLTNGMLLEEEDGVGGMRYTSENTGRYVEKRYPGKITAWVNGQQRGREDQGQIVEYEIVVPAGKIDSKSGVIPVYLEFKDGVNFIHTQANAGFDVTITVGGKSANIMYYGEGEE